jgi:hypothetical protein
VTFRRFVIVDCVFVLALVAVAFLCAGLGAALLTASALAIGHLGAWYSLDNSR